jgi:hypothetical protein
MGGCIFNIDTIKHGNEWSALCSGGITIGTHHTGGWTSLKAGLDAAEKRKTFANAGNRHSISLPFTP